MTQAHERSNPSPVEISSTIKQKEAPPPSLKRLRIAAGVLAVGTAFGAGLLIKGGGNETAQKTHQKKADSEFIIPDGYIVSDVGLDWSPEASEALPSFERDFNEVKRLTQDDPQELFNAFLSNAENMSNLEGGLEGPYRELMEEYQDHSFVQGFTEKSDFLDNLLLNGYSFGDKIHYDLKGEILSYDFSDDSDAGINQRFIGAMVEERHNGEIASVWSGGFSFIATINEQGETEWLIDQAVIDRDSNTDSS